MLTIEFGRQRACVDKEGRRISVDQTAIVLHWRTCRASTCVRLGPQFFPKRMERRQRHGRAAWKSLSRGIGNVGSAG
jgi:hypothetical protein